MSKIYFVSDLHINHQASLKFEGREHFSSVEEMNQTIIKNWNELVKPEDTVYNLGDCFLGKASESQQLLKSLNGHKLLIKGNHDNQSDHWYHDAGFEEIHRMLVLPSPTMPGRLTYIITHIPVPYTTIQALEGMYGHKAINLHGHRHRSNDPQLAGDSLLHPSSYVNLCVEVTNFSPVELEL